MDVLRRNTDYALRAVVNLAESFGDEALSTKELSKMGEIPYPLACKLLQRLQKKRLVRSSMGPNGGFRLSKDPSKITVLQVINAIQGPIRLNRCLLGVDECPRQPKCPISRKLASLQEHIENYLGGITLSELTQSREVLKKRR